MGWMQQRCPHSYLPPASLVFPGLATKTFSPSISESGGSWMTRSLPLRPVMICTLAPSSSPMTTGTRCATLPLTTVATRIPSLRKMSAAAGTIKVEPTDLRVTVRGSVEGMRKSFASFGIGLILSVILVYLILMAQFASFKDPFIILLAIPPGIMGVILFLLATNTTLNVMSLMGVVMMTGIVVSNSILIVEFTRNLREEGMPLEDAVAMACRVRLRPVLMTSLATILGMVPMALALEEGSELYAPLARAVIGGLSVSVVLTVFVVPAAYLIVHRQGARKLEGEQA